MGKRARLRIALSLIFLLLFLAFIFDWSPEPEPSPPSPVGSDVTIPELVVMGPVEPKPELPRKTPAVPGTPDNPGPKSFPHHVLVLDERGRPVEGAKVSARGEKSVTDARGLAGIPFLQGDAGMPSNDRYARTIHVSAAGHVPVNIKGQNREPYETVRLLERGGRLAGICVDTAGKPVAGVLLRTSGSWWNPGIEVVTDRKGRFETDQAPWRSQTLTMWDRVYLTEGVDVVPPQTDLVVTAVRPARISGVMHRPEGMRETIYSATRRLYMFPERPVRERFGNSGEFTIEFLPGPVELKWQRAVVDRFDLAEGETREGLEYTFPEPVERKRSSRRNSGETSGPTIRLEVPAMEDACPLVAGFGDGSYRILRKRFLSSGERISVGLPRPDLRWIGLDSWKGVTQKDLAPGTREVALSIESVAPVVGRVLDTHGTPIREGWISLRWPGYRRNATGSYIGGSGVVPPGAESLAEGGFRIRAAGPGRYDLAWCSEFLKEDIVLRRDIRMPDPPEEIDLGTLTVSPTRRTLRVLVTDSGLRPVSGAVVTLGITDPAMAARTDGGGRLECPIFDLTGFAIEVTAEGFETARMRTTTDQLPPRIEITLKPKR